jgi:superfamily I DNA/RNA helicase
LSLSNSLPPEREPDDNNHSRIQYEWWRFLVSMREPKITFDMIFSLAIYIVRNTPVIRNIIRQTYKYVFLDEFQDVTTTQYDLITSIFSGSGSIVTAVGDNQQAIMGWAGADARIYQKLAEDFGALPRNLNINFRSNHEIVNLINFLNSNLFNNTIETECARSQAGALPNAIQRWVFSSREEEGVYLARFIAQSLERDARLKQHDFLILTKIKANEVEGRMKEAFLQQGLRLRNEARTVGRIAIQDLLGDETFCFILASMKLAKNTRLGNPFQICRDFLANIYGINLGDDQGHTDATNRVRKLVNGLRNVVNQDLPGLIDGDDILECVLEHAPEDKIKKIIKEYGGGDRFEQVKESFSLFFNECSDVSSSWEECFSNIEGTNQVKLMTIHKSKGLEYHTVIFTELNDDAFWGNPDEVKLFFVALSRAREMVRFSFVRGQRGYTNVRRFEQLLNQAGVSTEQVDV